MTATIALSLYFLNRNIYFCQAYDISLQKAHMICKMVNVQNNAKYLTQCQDKKKQTKSRVI